MKSYTLSIKELNELFWLGELKQEDNISFYISDEGIIYINDNGHEKIIKDITISNYLHVPKKTKFEEYYSPAVEATSIEDWLKD